MVPTELGSGGFESLLEHDSKAQPPSCICLVLHIASQADKGRMMQMPLVSKFLCYVEAAARRELWQESLRVCPPRAISLSSMDT